MEKEFWTLAEAAEYVGLKRATLYNYMDDLGLKAQKYGRNRRKYLTLAEVERLKEYKDTPWKVKVETRKEDEATDKREAVNVVPPALSLKQKPQNTDTRL